MKVKMILDSLKRKGKMIDWKNSIECEVDFEYEDLKGKIKLIQENAKINKIA